MTLLMRIRNLGKAKNNAIVEFRSRWRKDDLITEARKYADRWFNFGTDASVKQIEKSCIKNDVVWSKLRAYYYNQLPHSLSRSFVHTVPLLGHDRVLMEPASGGARNGRLCFEGVIPVVLDVDTRRVGSATFNIPYAPRGIVFWFYPGRGRYLHHFQRVWKAFSMYYICIASPRRQHTQRQSTGSK